MKIFLHFFNLHGQRQELELVFYIICVQELMKKLERIELEDSLDTTSSSLETVVELEDEKPEPSLETVVEIEVENTEPEPSQSKPAQSNPILFL